MCLVSNNSYVDQLAFDGMRKHLLQDFTQIYHLDLHGNVRKNPKLSGTTHNVFGIQVGVGITIAVRATAASTRGLYYSRVPEGWRKQEKLAYLREMGDAGNVPWRNMLPDERHNWVTEGMRSEYSSFPAIGTREAKTSRGTDLGGAEVQTIFKTYSLGVNTARDHVAYDFSFDALAANVAAFAEDYNAEVSRWVRTGRPENIDAFVQYDRVKWSRNLKRDLRGQRYIQFGLDAIRRAQYRPFTSKWLYYADLVVDERGTTGRFFPVPATEKENAAVAMSDHGYRSPFSVLGVNAAPDLHFLASTDGFQCFPFYTYAEDGSNRRENITDWALAQFQARYGGDVTKWDIFHYVYGILHHPQYRARYAENLKRELPRIPLLPERAQYDACVRAGRELMRAHLGYEQAREYPLRWVEAPGAPVNWRVEKMKLSADKTTLRVNDWLTLEGIPAECGRYRLGNRSALEWVVDQYRVTTDKRSGITSDPNRAEEPEYIVRLVGRVVTVSVETVRLVGEMARAVDLLAALGVGAREAESEGAVVPCELRP